MLQKEPAVLIGAIEAAAIALVGVVAVAFEWDPEFSAVVVGAVGAVIALIAAVLVRLKVYSPATYEADVEAARREQPPA